MSFRLWAGLCSFCFFVILIQSQVCAEVVIAPEKELLMTHLGVVEDPIRTAYLPPSSGRSQAQGAWSFGRALENLAGGADPSQELTAWLQSFTVDQSVGAWSVDARPALSDRVLGSWVRASRERGISTGLDLSIAPFRLLAIVNRMDLRKVTPSGECLDAGEGRLVYGFTDLDAAAAGSTDTLQATVILEYELVAKDCADVKLWAKAWHSLGARALQSEDYNKRLQVITDHFTRRGLASDRLRGRLRKLRTSEGVQSASLWEWREYQWDDALGGLRQIPVAQNPDITLNRSSTLDDFVTQNADLILEGKHEVPDWWGGVPFRGGSALLQVPWTLPDGSSVDGEVRHRFAKQTCTGCHGREVPITGLAFHIAPRLPGRRARVSQFLTGITSFSDPVNPAITRPFNELEKRAQSLRKALGE